MGDFRRKEVLVWSWSLEAAALVGDDAEAMLSVDERQRRQSFLTPDLRRRFLAARSGLRLVLARHLDRNPRALSFSSNEFGKPRLMGGKPVHFNLSHSGERAVLAVSDDVEVGIDLEQIRAIEHVDLARRYFHRNEVAAIERLRDTQEQHHAFFRIWTLKEAVVKALGTGLSTPLDSFEISIASSRPAMARAPMNAPRTWWLQQATMDGYCLALAVPGVGDVGLTHCTI